MKTFHIKIAEKAEKIILIIGNGFDKANNLSTSYSQFFEYIEKIYKKKKQQNSSNFYDQVDNEKNQFDANYFINFFLKTRIPYENWFDLEEELANILTVVMKFISLMNKIEYENNNTANSAYFLISEKDLSDIKKVDHNFLRLKFLMNWEFFKYKELEAEDPLSYGNKSTTFYKVFINGLKASGLFEPKNLLEFKKEVINKLWKDFSYLESVFNQYLEKMVNPEINKLNHINIHKCINSEKDIGKIISYNYTRTPQHIFGINDNDVFYIHGRDDDLIFGVDEDIIDDNIRNKVSDLRACFLNFYKNSIPLYYYEKKHLDLPKFIGKTTHFYIFGHSINKQDLNSLRRIFGSAFDDKFITIFYRNEDDRHKIENNLCNLLGDRNKFVELCYSKHIKLRPSSDFKFS